VASYRPVVSAFGLTRVCTTIGRRGAASGVVSVPNDATSMMPACLQLLEKGQNTGGCATPDAEQTIITTKLLDAWRWRSRLTGIVVITSVLSIRNTSTLRTIISRPISTQTAMARSLTSRQAASSRPFIASWSCFISCSGDYYTLMCRYFKTKLQKAETNDTMKNDNNVD